MVTMTTQWQNEFDLHARALLGLPVDASLRNPGASAVIYGAHDTGALSFDGVAEALSAPGIDLRLFGKPNSFIKRRMGVVLARADTAEVARTLAKSAAARIRPRPTR
jgi:phosphoribosylglycinamide formyltransferase 2